MRKISFVCFLACLFAFAANARVCFLPNIFGGGESCLLGIGSNTAAPGETDPQPGPAPTVPTCAEGTVSSKLSGENRDMFIYYETNSIATCYLVYCSGWRGSSTSNNINTSIWTTSSATYGGKLCYFATGCREPYRSDPCVGTETTEEEYHIDDLVCYRCQQHCPVVTCEGYTVQQAPENGRLVGSPCQIVNEDCSEGDVLYKFECNEGYTPNGNTCEIAQCDNNFATEEDKCVGSCAGSWKLGLVTSGKSGTADCKNCVCCIPEDDETYSGYRACYGEGSASDGCGGTRKTYTYLCTEDQTCTSSGCCTPTADDTYSSYRACYTRSTEANGCGGTRTTYTYNCTADQNCTSSGCVDKCTPEPDETYSSYRACYTQGTASNGCGGTKITYTYNCTANQNCTSSGCVNICIPAADETYSGYRACWTQGTAPNGCGGTKITYTYKCSGNEECTSSGCVCTPTPDDTYSGYRACYTQGTASNGCGGTRTTYTYNCTGAQECTSSGCQNPVVCNENPCSGYDTYTKPANSHWTSGSCRWIYLSGNECRDGGLWYTGWACDSGYEQSGSSCVSTCTPAADDTYTGYRACWQQGTEDNGCGGDRITYTYKCSGNEECTSSGCVACTPSGNGEGYSYLNCMTERNSDGCGGYYYTSKCTNGKVCNGKGSCVNSCTPAADDTYTGYRACWQQGTEDNGCGGDRITYTYKCSEDQICRSSGCCTPSGDGQKYSLLDCMTKMNSDGCGGYYYTSNCTGGKVCNGYGSCVNACTPSGNGQAYDYNNCLTVQNDDGCGGSYYTTKCSGSQTCNGSGSCVSACTPSGNGQARDYSNCLTISNDDGCGGTYYTSKCTGSQICNGSGSCVTPCTPTGNGQARDYNNCLTVSNSDGCGGTYYTSKCTGDQTCNGSGSCVTLPSGCTSCSEFGSMYTALCDETRCIRDLQYCGSTPCFRYYTYGPSVKPRCDICKQL